MTPYGKTAQTAISAITRLAQIYDPLKRARANSAEIAEIRHLPQPVVAKVLTILSQAGLITGSPGPGGGYALARSPAEISLYDVASLFSREEEQLSCPFGPDWCGNGPQCPLHSQLEAIRERMIQFLKGNTLAVFVKWNQDKGGVENDVDAVQDAKPTGAIPLPLFGTRSGKTPTAKKSATPD